MERMQIICVEKECVYHLINNEGHCFQFIFNFINTEKKPKQGDYIFWSKNNMIDDELATRYRTYGGYTTNNAYVRHGSQVEDVDFIVVVSDNDMYIMQRYYG